MEKIENKARQEFETDRRELDESELDENELNVISGGCESPRQTFERWLKTEDGPNIARYLFPG
jgi:bacteriocin-like protein